MPSRASVIEPPPPPVSTINEYIPKDRALTECISALPPPGCGSAAKEDWAQGALFGVLVAALVFIAWRIVRSARRHNAAQRAAADGAAPAPAARPGGRR